MNELLRSARFWAYTTWMACSMGTLYVLLGMMLAAASLALLAALCAAVIERRRLKPVSE